MEFIKNNTSELEATLIVKIEESDYRERVDKEIKKISKSANIKGFRPGNVPKQMIEKLYGKDVLAQEVTKMLDEKVKEYLTNEKIELLGELLPSTKEETKFDIEKDKNYVFAFDIAYYPETKIDIEKIAIPYYNIKVDDSKIDKEIESMQEKYGSFTEMETPDEKSNIKVDLVELDDEKNPKEGGINVKDTRILIEFVEKTPQKQLLKTKKGDKIVFNIKKAIKNETELATILKTEKDKLDAVSENFELTVNQIENYSKAELNQEFFDKLFGPDQVKSKEELRSKVREIIENQFKSESRLRFRIDFKNTIEKEIGMQLPEEFIIRWQLYRQTGKTEEDIRKNIENYKEAIKWDRILSILAKEHNLEVEYQDMLDTTKANIVNMLYQYGLNPGSLPEETLNHYATQELEKMKEEDRTQLYFSTVERKVIDGMFEKVKKDEKEITFDELLELYKDQKESKEEKSEESKEETVEKKEKKVKKTKKDQSEQAE